MTLHSIVTPVTFEDDDVSFDLDLEITFEHERGDPGVAPSLSYAGDPPTGDSVEFASASPVNPAGVKLALGRDLTPDEIVKLGRDWLKSDFGYERACRDVAEDRHFRRSFLGEE